MKQYKVELEKIASTCGNVLEAEIAIPRGLFREVVVEGKVDFDELKATLGEVLGRSPKSVHAARKKRGF
jgi:hypothetical protein